MFSSRHNGTIIASLVFAVFLWGGNNTGVKFLVQAWPPVWVGSTRFLCAGLLLFAVLRWTNWMGPGSPLTSSIKQRLWWRGGLSLAAYIVVFNWSLQFTAASHVALYLGASPVWALLWEGRGGTRPYLVKRYGAAGLALVGVLVLFWPALGNSSGSLMGEFLGLTASVLWTFYGRQCRYLGGHLSGAEVTAHTIWRAGVLLLPLALVEVMMRRGIVWRADLVFVQIYCIIAGGVIAFALWTNALRHWKTSEVYLFNNLIPLSTMGWAHVWLGEPVTHTFWLAMVFIVSGVLIGQANWQKIFNSRWLPTE